MIVNANTIDRLTLTQNTIDQLKQSIARKENILEEDITDAQVFEYVCDLEEAEDGIKTNGSKYTEDWEYRKPRNVGQIIDDLLYETSDDSWLAYF